MGLTTLTLPRLGETMEEARVTDWLVAPGQAFARGDVLLEVETDKTVVEVPALVAGTLRVHLVGPGEMVEIGQAIAEVEEAGVPSGADPAPMAPPGVVSEPLPALATADALLVVQPDPTLRVAASPRARRLARAGGVDLARIAGSGRGGRVTGADVAGITKAGAVQPDAGSMLFARHGRDTGAGAVLLLHGLFAQAEGFAGLPARLAGSRAQVLVPDLPGHGQSPPADGLRGIEAGLAALIDAQAPTGPLRLVGHSMGAILATRLAQRYGDRVVRLVLLAPAGLGPRMNRDFLDILSHAETPAALRHGLAHLGAGPVSDAVVAKELALLLRHRAAQRALARELASGGVQQIDITAELAALDTPTRVLFGTSDAVFDWRDCARLPARVAVHMRAGAGHLPHLGAEALVESLVFA